MSTILSSNMSFNITSLPYYHKKKSVGLSQADALTNHIINNTKTNNQ